MKIISYSQMEHRCLICGKKLHDPFAIYCTECEYEIKRARLADEETLEDYIERVKVIPKKANLEGIKPLDVWFSSH